eukprot:12656451-Alexandrium_andersonii.AAC.1
MAARPAHRLYPGCADLTNALARSSTLPPQHVHPHQGPEQTLRAEHGRTGEAWRPHLRGGAALT